MPRFLTRLGPPMRGESCRKHRAAVQILEGEDRLERLLPRSTELVTQRAIDAGRSLPIEMYSLQGGGRQARSHQHALLSLASLPNTLHTTPGLRPTPPHESFPRRDGTRRVTWLGRYARLNSGL